MDYGPIWNGTSMIWKDILTMLNKFLHTFWRRFPICWWEYAKRKESYFWGRFKGLGGPARMRKPPEMYTASRMQNIVPIRTNNSYSVIIFLFWKSSFGALGVESPDGGAIFLESLWERSLEDPTVSFNSIMLLFVPSSHVQKYTQLLKVQVNKQTRLTCVAHNIYIYIV